MSARASSFSAAPTVALAVMDDHNYSRAHLRPKSIILSSQVFGETVPEEDTLEYFQPEKLNDCGIIKCEIKGHCKGYHCPVCPKTGFRYKMKSHFFTVHWATRITVGNEINSVLCKCKIPDKITPRHWHCPYCNCNPYFRIKYVVSHISRIHKPNKVVKGYSKQRIRHVVDCRKEDAGPSSHNTATPDTFNTNDLRDDTHTPKRKVKAMDFSLIGKHGMNVLRSMKPANGKGWYCSLCPFSGQKCRIRNHIVSVHWASRIEVGDKVSVMCKCDQPTRSGQGHWHCQFCRNQYTRAKKLILHILNDHKSDNLVKRFSFGKLNGTFSRQGEAIVSMPADKKEVEPTESEKSTSVGEVIRCIAPGHCKGWHCSYCTFTSLRYKVKNHIQAVHYGSRLEIDDKVAIMCKCNNFNRRTPRHWHCPICSSIAFANSRQLLNHALKEHKASVKRYCQGKLVNVIKSCTKPQVVEKKKKPDRTGSLLYNGSCIDAIKCDGNMHCYGWHCPFCDKTGSRAKINKHLKTVHFGSRLQVGGMKSILCKCLKTDIKRKHHYHCPICANKSFRRTVYLKDHILQTHKPTANIELYSRNQVIEVVECRTHREVMETDDADAKEIVETKQATETQTLIKVETSPPNEDRPCPQNIDIRRTRKLLKMVDVIDGLKLTLPKQTAETEKLREVETSRPDKEDLDQQNDWDMIKCTEPEHCKGWHCSLCTTTGDIEKLKHHFVFQHCLARLEVGDLIIVTCKCRKASGLGHSHYHCPLCINRSFSRILTFEEHFVYWHQPFTVVKRFSRGNLVSKVDNSTGKAYKPRSMDDELETIDVPPPQQNLSEVECTVLGHCKGWHCRFCSTTGERYKLKKHIFAVHWGCRVEMGESYSVMCKCPHSQKTTPRHWHCPLCAHSTFVKAFNLEHHLIRVHKTTKTVKRFSSGKLVAVNGVLVSSDCNEPIDLPPPSTNLDLVTIKESDVAVEEMISFTNAWDSFQKELMDVVVNDSVEEH